MALKKSEALQGVSHELFAGSKEQLDELVAAKLQAGWYLIEAKVLLFDRINGVLEVFYVFSKTLTPIA